MAATIAIRVKNEAKPGIADVVRDVTAVEAAAEGIGEAFEDVIREMQQNNTVAAEQKLVVADLRRSWLHFTAETITDLKTVGGAVRDVTDAAFDQVRKVKDLAEENRKVGLAVGLVQTAAVRGAAAWTSYGVAVGSVLSVVGGVKAGLLALDTVLANTGKKSNALGEIESNLDRARAASRGLREDIGALAGEGVGQIKDLATATASWAYEATGLKAGWEEFDRQITERTDNWVTNARALGSAIRGVSRDAVDAAVAIETAQNASRDDFERVRESNASAEASAKSRAEAVRIAGLATTKAIDEELQKLKERRGTLAASSQFDAAAQKSYLDGVEALERRRAQILDERKRSEDEARRQQLEADRNSSNEYARQWSRALDDRNAKILKEQADYERSLDEEVQALIRQHQRQQQAFEQQTKQRADEAQKQRDTYIARWREAVGEVADLVRGKQGGGASDQIEQVKQSLSQRDVATQVGKQREAAALLEFDRGANDKRNQLREQGMLGAQADARVEAERRKVALNAFTGGFRDTMRGKNADEATAAQNQLISAITNNAAASGELAPLVAQGLQQAAQQAIQASQEAIQAKAIAQQVLNALGASQQRMRGVNGTLKR